MQYNISHLTTHTEPKGFETNIISNSKIVYSVYGLTQETSRLRAENLASLLNSLSELQNNQLYRLSLI